MKLILGNTRNLLNGFYNGFQRYCCSLTNQLNRLNMNNYNMKSAFPFEDIPTARRLPLVGTTLDLILAGSAPQLHKYIDNRHQKLGPIFREKLGPIEAVFLSSPNLMRSVFLYEGQHPAHPLPESWMLYNKKNNCRRGLFFMNGEEWHHNRKIMNRLLLNSNLVWMNNLIEESTKQITDKWKLKNKTNQYQEIENLEQELYRWSIDIIIAIMFGKNVKNMASKDLENIINEFSSKVQEIFKNSSKLMNFPPKIAEYFHLKIWSDFEKNVTEVLKLGNHITDLIISENQCSNGLFTKMRENDMPIDDIKRIFVDLIMAAGDTTAFSTEWALYSLACNPEIQNQARLSIETNSSDLPYLRGIIRETLRLYPVAPFIGRFLAKDAIIGNYKINQNTLVLLSLYTSGRDERNFPKPLEFEPKRWLRNENGELDGVHQAHGTLPFAIGSRSCIGRKIAIAQMQSFLSNVVSNFDLICLNENPVEIILRMVAVPNSEIKLAIKNLN